MRRIGLPLVVAMILLGLSFLAAPAQAQSVVWVSSGGDNDNSCTSPATACAGFFGILGALAKVDPGGVIHALPGNYAPVIINKSVKIIAGGEQASIWPTSSINGGGFSASFAINAPPTDVVVIKGMIVDRRNINSIAIGLVSAAALHLENCILASGSFGLWFHPNSDSELVISNCTIANNGLGGSGGGIQIKPAPGASANVTLNNVRIVNNRVGLMAFTRTKVMVRNSTISGNTVGVRAKGGNAVVRIADSAVTANQTGLSVLNGAQIVSHRGNVVADNTTDGSFTSTVQQQ